MHARQALRSSRIPRSAAFAAVALAAAAAFLSLVPAASAAKPVEVSQPTIEGTARQDRTISAGVGIWANTPLSYTYQWHRCNAAGAACAPLSGQTGATYGLTAADVGSTLVVLVTATNADGSTQANSRPSSVVSANVLPAATVKPAVTGTAAVGSQLTASTGTWTGGPTLTYQWQRCNAAGASCTDVTGATGSTYGVLAADAGSTLVAVVTARNEVGSVGSASAATAVVAGLNAARPADATTLPSGETSVPASTIALPQRLIVSAAQITPRTFASRTTKVTVKVRVTDTRGWAVSNARVALTVLPGGWATAGGAQRTATDGWATFTVTPTARLPILRTTAVWLLAQATKDGDTPNAGVSATRLLQVKVRPA